MKQCVGCILFLIGIIVIANFFFWYWLGGFPTVIWIMIFDFPHIILALAIMIIGMYICLHSNKDKY